jgi:hypothetical protein
MAGVVPTVFDLPIGTEPLAYVISANVKRRNLTAAQRAIAAAEAWGMAIADGLASERRGPHTPEGGISTPDRHFATMFGVGKNAVQQARALLDRAPTAASKVKAGEADLIGSYNALREVETRAEREEEALRQAEAEIEERRERLRTLSATVADLLPPPTVEALAAAVDTEASLTAAAVPPTDDAETAGAVAVWERTMHSANDAATALRALGAFPESSRDADLLRVSAVEIARRLGDAAARLLAALPEEHRLRRVQ